MVLALILLQVQLNNEITFNMNNEFISRPAILVKQPLGHFFVFTLDAETLNSITYSLPAEVRVRLEQEQFDKGRGYSIFGSQRKESKSRLEEISKFIQTSDATFPNSIILATNYDQDGLPITDPKRRWGYIENAGLYTIEIPKTGASASIIDGQHRLHAFDLLPSDSQRRQMELLCVAFFELPPPYHAYIFSTINFNQKKVDRSLAYELFGFDPDLKDAQFWPPETLAVYLARVLNTEVGSPFRRCIAPAADSDELISLTKDESTGTQEKDGVIRVSMASVVDGILSLICKKPKDDRYKMRSMNNTEKGRSVLSHIEELPLRNLYLENNDKAILEVLINYWTVVNNSIWSNAQPDSYLLKTVGIQAQFDILKMLILNLPLNAENYSKENLAKVLADTAELAKEKKGYQASGIGRVSIRNDLIQKIPILAHLSTE
ncbi:MAG: DGQHR domain-containing protein [Dehalococcoidales bacterium]|nr:DGQHR domain-containing protein [Dehalococcoidales bacterium]